MPPEIISLHELKDDTEAVELSVKTLRQGKLVVFPTETVYGLAALASDANAVKRLCDEKGRSAMHALPIAISGSEALKRYAPDLPPLALRLTRRFWPGPLTLVLDVADSSSELNKLPKESLMAIMPEGAVGFRTPKNNFLLRALQILDEPIVLTSANLSGKAPATSALEAQDALGKTPELIIDDGKADFGQPSTVVKLSGKEATILREGAISNLKLSQAMAKVIVFVCTGNTCRSPMAEVVCQKILAEHLGVPTNELEANGYIVLSAGVAAQSFCPASSQACHVVAHEYGLSLDNHASHSFDSTLAQVADLVFTMTASHKSVLLSYYPELQDRVFLLSVSNDDIADPFGAPVAEYSACARQIEEQIRLRLAELID